MHCRSCGAPLWPGSEICASCGTAVAAPAPAAVPPLVAAPLSDAPRPARSSRTMVTSIVACVVLAAGALAAIVATHTPAKSFSISDPGLTELPSLPEAPVPTLAIPGSRPNFAPSTAKHVWHLTETAGGGSKLALTLTLGKPQPATSGRTIGTPGQTPLTLDSTCDHIDPSVDAVVAAQLLIKNANAEPMPVGYSFDINGPTAVDAIEIAEDSGARCKVGMDATAVVTSWGDALPAGSSRTSNMFFVLHGYYSMSANERVARLENARILFGYADGRNAAGTDELLTPSTPVGPDVGMDGSVPLSG